MRLSLFTILLTVTPFLVTGCLGDFEAESPGASQDQLSQEDPPAGNPPVETDEPNEMPEDPGDTPDEPGDMPEEPAPPMSGSPLGPQPIAGSGMDGDYYVAPNGNDSNSGTMSQPFKTISKAASKARAGDLIYIRGGLYGGFKISNLKGQSNAPIIFRAFPEETPIFDGRLGDYEGYIALLYGDNHYLTFDGLTFTDTSPEFLAARKLDLSKSDDVEEFKKKYLPKLSSIFLAGIRVSPSDKKDSDGKYIDKPTGLVFRNLTIHQVGSMAISINDRTSNYTVENSLLYDIGYPKSGYGVYTHGKNFTFRNNIVHDSVYGLHVYDKSSTLTGTVIENNYFYNIGLRAYWHKSSGKVKVGGVGVLVDDPGEGARVINNIVRNCSVGISASLPKMVVAHNLVYDCKTGLSVAEENVQVYNNVIHSNDKNFNFSTSPSINKGTITTSSVVLIDNAKAERGIASVDSVKDKGFFVEGVTKDILGKTRDGSPDIGPFEQ